MKNTENEIISPEQTLAFIELDLDAGLLPATVFGDPDIYSLELRKISARAWVFVGHESELPNPGDFALRNIGEDSFIFIRDSGGEIRVLFNACRHRGTQLCRVDKGNTTHFVCPYHGWTYKNSGDLQNVPAKKLGYRSLELAEWGLLPAPNVESYCGLVFANLDPDALPLESYLGRYSWYLDTQFKLTQEGMEVLGEPHRWIADANWKQGAENFCGDSAHTQMTHRSVMEAGMVPASTAGAPGGAYGLQIHECDGHAISIRQHPGADNLFWEYPEEVWRHFTDDRIGSDRFELVRRSVAHVGTVFPNFSFLHTGLTDSADRPPGAFLSLRVWQPKGPGKTEIWNWILAPKEASDSYKERAYRLGMSSFSPSGNFEQDDVTLWPGVGRAANSVFADLQSMKLNYQMGLGDMFHVEPIEDWPGPGTAVPSNAGEGGLRTFHRSWLRWMRADEGRPVAMHVDAVT